MPKNAILDPNKVALPGVMEKLIEHVTEGSLRREMRSSGTTMPHDNAYGLRREKCFSGPRIAQTMLLANTRRLLAVRNFYSRNGS